MVLGVSTRRYARLLEPLPHEAAVHGIGKSAVSERFVAGTKRKLDQLMQRDLSGLALAALMIDGVRFAEHVILAAIGIDQHGRKHVLDLREGATENTAGARSSNAARRISAAMCWRRCPSACAPRPIERSTGAYAAGDVKRARRLLEHLAQQLENPHPGAAVSLREELDETLTVMRLKLPRGLARVLSSTNLIENLFSRVREISRRRHWQGDAMALRWTAAGVLEAERGFRRLVGCDSMPKLVAALRAHDNALDRMERRIDDADKAA
jgi:putative transposase